MRFSTAITIAFSALVGFVAAADSKCAAQSIVDACVSGYKSRIDACIADSNNYICLCDVYTDVLVCYNNCPDSNEKFPVQGQVSSYCTAAQPLRAAASASVASVASVAATQTHASTSTSATATGSGTSSATSAVASSFQSTGGAGALSVPAGAALIALFGAML